MAPKILKVLFTLKFGNVGKMQLKAFSHNPKISIKIAGEKNKPVHFYY
jgi:hypothetical protein